LDFPFTFGLGPSEPAITSNSDLWSAPLPASRRAFGTAPDSAAFDPQVTYGDYFSAARDFLTQDGAAMLRSAVSRLAGRPVTAGDVGGVGVFLVKHGAFYHPSFIKALVCDRWWPLVLNVAVSGNGRAILEREFHNLERLNQETTAPYWPRVFGCGCGRSARGRQLPMFLGQWLEGFHEFHLSMDANGGHPQVVVWDDGRANPTLTAYQVQELLRQAALILAYAYNPLTFEAILDWHHAAGDFVVNLAGVGLDVRLVVVRRYGPMVELEQPDVAAVLDALLVYLVDLSLRLRVDRSDGAGSVVCHPPQVVSAICLGFLQGIQAGAARHGLPEDFIQTVRPYFALHDGPALVSIVDAILAKYPSHDDARRLLQTDARAHATVLAQALAEP
jgi:hypothetical protein